MNKVVRIAIEQLLLAALVASAGAHAGTKMRKTHAHVGPPGQQSAAARPVSGRAVVSPYARAAAAQRQAGISAQPGAIQAQRVGHAMHPRQPSSSSPQ